MDLPPFKSLSILPNSLFIHGMIFSSCLILIYSGFPARASMNVLVGNETDRLSLLAIKETIMADPFQIMSSWNESIHFCHWQGVTCSRRHQRVTMLDLNSYQLAGSLPPQIGNMSFLRVLALQNNSYGHEIPQEIGRLFRLQTLNLENNSFRGEIPANISHCSNLIYLGLGGNKLVGNVPMELSSLSKLQDLFLDSNNLTGGIPPSFGNFSSLETLSAAKNNFEGSIPHTLSNLKVLRYLALGENKLSGMISPSIFNLSAINSINLRQNQIRGSLPSDLGLALPNLHVFNVFNNQFSGAIPVSISNASNLFGLSFAMNNFIGKVPNFAGLHSLQMLRINNNHLGDGKDNDLDFLSSLTNCSNLEMICISSNNLSGLIPSLVSNFSIKLTKLSLGRNRIRGNIPSGIGNLVNLEQLDMEINQLSSAIPTAIGRLHKLIELFLNGNKLIGSIPSSLGNLTRLTQLNLSSNNLEGNIPSSLGKCHNLVAMLLSRNNLGGTIPRQVIGLSSLSIILDLSQNHLTGPISIEVGNLKNLGRLDVSSNKLSGGIPTSLGSCLSLEYLSMRDNLLNGTIPQSLGSLRGLQNLDLSSNNFSGQIPKYLENFSLLLSLNLSSNNFEGEVPTQGVFKNASAISIKENRGLCGGIPQLELPRCSSNESKGPRLSHTLKLIISITTALVGLTLIFSLFSFKWLRKTRKEPPPTFSSETFFSKVSFKDLLKATDGFSSANLIGTGSFGSVYKGSLGEEETTVAVKVLNLQHKGASKSFMAECEALRNVRHRNLVKILTACSSVDFQGNDFKALVYEFMVNGSLEEWLHPIPRADQVQEQRYLNLVQRLNIAIDVANSLDYLYHHCETTIVHCDLKPSNILMDGDMTARVADFGLARILSRASHQRSSNQPSSVGMKGSIGYAAPEYGMGSQASTYGDMYSYGILLLELFTGKRPTNDMFKDNLNLHKFVQMALPDRVVEVVDPVLLREDEEETNTEMTHKNCVRSHRIHECLTSIVKIGVACSAELPKERMDINNVAVELCQIRKTFLETSIHGRVKHHSSTRR